MVCAHHHHRRRYYLPARNTTLVRFHTVCLRVYHGIWDSPFRPFRAVDHVSPHRGKVCMKLCPDLQTTAHSRPKGTRTKNKNSRRRSMATTHSQRPNRRGGLGSDAAGSDGDDVPPPPVERPPIRAASTRRGAWHRSTEHRSAATGWRAAPKEIPSGGPIGFAFWIANLKVHGSKVHA